MRDMKYIVVHPNGLPIFPRRHLRRETPERILPKDTVFDALQIGVNVVELATGQTAIIQHGNVIYAEPYIKTVVIDPIAARLDALEAWAVTQGYKL
jgi:hypothetical protein